MSAEQPTSDTQFSTENEQAAAGDIADRGYAVESNTRLTDARSAQLEQPDEPGQNLQTIPKKFPRVIGVNSRWGSGTGGSSAQSLDSRRQATDTPLPEEHES